MSKQYTLGHPTLDLNTLGLKPVSLLQNWIHSGKNTSTLSTMELPLVTTSEELWVRIFAGVVAALKLIPSQVYYHLCSRKPLGQLHYGLESAKCPASCYSVPWNARSPST